MGTSVGKTCNWQIIFAFCCQKTTENSGQALSSLLRTPVKVLPCLSQLSSCPSLPPHFPSLQMVLRMWKERADFIPAPRAQPCLVMPQRNAPRAGRATAVVIGRAQLSGCGPAWHGTAFRVVNPMGEFHVDNCLSASCKAALRHLLLLFCSKSIHLQTEMRTSWWLLGFILEKKNLL